jgi:predicted ATPase/DNA-binding CsgD family transcriptional regulator
MRVEGTHSAAPPFTALPLTALSRREAEVLEAVGRHLSNAQIATQLYISVRTVESHVSSLLRKFGASDRRELAELAPAMAERVPSRPGDGPVAGLPVARTSFIGRDQEQVSVLAALTESRVVTLVGPGGVGKTRLAARAAETVADSYPFGSVFVDLVPASDGFLTEKVAGLLGLTEPAGRDLDVVLQEFLAKGRSLLVLDNCEHLLGLVAAFAEKLLANCSGLTILTTSRERLAIPGERTVTVPPMSLLADGESGGGQSEAEALFMDRARVIDPGFEAAPRAVREVCRRLDGVPLAIELAAARSVSLGVDGLLAGLDDHLRLLAGSRAPHERHRSLRAVIDWSHDLLDSDERALLRRAAVFAGGFDLDAATAMWGAAEVGGGGDRASVADLVGRLTDKSLLTHRRGGGSRWQMLGTIRAYALDRLAVSGEETAVRDAHLGWAAAVADGLERQLETLRPGQVLAWREAFDTVADDLRAALARALTPETDGASHRLARTLGHLAYARRFMVESCEHYRTAAGRAAGPGEAAADLRTAADVAIARGDGGTAFELLLASARRAQEAGDGAAASVALAYAATIADRFWADFPDEMPHGRIREVFGQAKEACPAGHPLARAYLTAADAWTAVPEKTVPDRELAHAALDAARETGDLALISGGLDAVVGVLDSDGHLFDAYTTNQERAALLDRMPRHDPRYGVEIVDTFHMVTEIAVTAGALPDALASAQKAEKDDIAGGQPHMTASKPIFPLILLGRFDEAFRQAEIMWEAWERAGRPAARRLAPATYAVILGYGLRGDADGKRVWAARLDELIGRGPDRVSGTNLAAVAAFTEARIALHEGRLDAALAATGGLLTDAASWYEDSHWQSMRPYAWAIAAEVTVVTEPGRADAKLAAAAPAGAENLWAAACLARARGRRHGDRAELEQAVAGWERIDDKFERACTLLLMADRAQEGVAGLRELGCQPGREFSQGPELREPLPGQPRPSDEA